MNLNYTAESLKEILLNEPHKVVVADIEADGLLDTINKVHCISQQPLHGVGLLSHPKGIGYGVTELNKYKVIVMHNAHGYDVPALSKCGYELTPIIIDTLVWSRFLFPNINEIDSKQISKGKYHLNPKERQRPHSIGTWGKRLGLHKGDFGDTTDWSEYTPEMGKYCQLDVSINIKVLELLIEKLVSWEALVTEQKVSQIIQRQKEFGWLFDHENAEQLYNTLITRKRQHETDLQQIFPARFKPKNPGKIFTPKRDNKKMGYSKGCPMTKIELVDFNPGSDIHIREELKRRYGFKSWEKTKAGKDSVKGEVLEHLAEFGWKGKPVPEAAAIADYKRLLKIAGMVGSGEKSWLQVYDTETSRVHGYISSTGAVTARMTHSDPNISQVPSTKVKWGKECRELFIVPEGYSLVGADAAGLEARCLAHYLARYDNGKFAQELLSGDIHTATQKAAHLPSRDTAKTFFYAFLYGAGPAKLGTFIGGGWKEGKGLRERFLKGFPALKKLGEDVVKNATLNGYLKTIDGRQLPIRSKHSALNTLLQSCGAIIMKLALVIMEEKLSYRNVLEYGTDYAFVGNIHDEVQLQVKHGWEEDVGERLVESMIEAGEQLNLRCPLDGEYKVGKSWAETH